MTPREVPTILHPFKDEHIPHVWHRLNEVQRTTALQYFLDLPDWLQFDSRQEYLYFMKTTHPGKRGDYPTRSDFNKAELKTLWNWHEVDYTKGWHKGDSRLCLEEQGTSVASTVLLRNMWLYESYVSLLVAFRTLRGSVHPQLYIHCS
jgi:hypothetical protein